MCLIILREPNVTLDFEKFKTTVINNPDGWGISIPDGEGRLMTYRQVETDVDELYEYLHDDLKDSKFMLHLRFTTAGDTVLRNAHPFPILEKSKDGADLRMAHNGTLGQYKPAYNAPNKWESDTRVFTREYVRPLFKRLVLGRTLEEVLSDEFTDTLVDSQLTAASVATFIDGSGNTLLVNAKGNGGFVDEDGTYYSNKYSFDVDHRKPPVYGGNYWQGQQQQGGTNLVGKTQGTTGVTTSGTKTSTTEDFTDCNVEKFSDKYDLGMKDDLYLLSDEAIELLIDEEPEDAALLVKELLFKLYEAENKLEKATKAVARKSQLIKELEQNNLEIARHDEAA